MKNLRVVIGPPGCGKTTHLCRSAGEAAKRYGADKVLITSMTRAAAAEVKSRGLNIPASSIKTMHAHAWAALGRPGLVSGKHLAEWNRHNPKYQISSLGSLEEDDGSAFPLGGAGDELLAMYDLFRARMEKEEFSSKKFNKAFCDRWDDFKKQNSLLDFGDLIELAMTDTDAAPGKPAVIYADEVQDYSKAEIKLLSHWAESANGTVVVGDVDQTIYDWRGSDPKEFISLVNHDNSRVLSQSYRVPKAVHQYASRWIRQIKNRIDAEYRPTPEEGAVKKSGDDFKRQAFEIVQRAVEETKQGRSVMILAYCAYMLQPIVAEMRRQGITYHNPYKSSRGDWNPLRQEGGGITTARRLQSFLTPPTQGRFWSPRELSIWGESCKTEGIFVRGAKAEFSKTVKSKEASADSPYGQVNDFAGYFVSKDAAISVFEAAASGDFNWLKANSMGSKTAAFAYPVNVLRRGGLAYLAETPKIIVGTIHSVKGGEADVVYVSPDLSTKGASGGMERRDSLVRTFYVAFTRARHKLVLCSPVSYAARMQFL